MEQFPCISPYFTQKFTHDTAQYISFQTLIFPLLSHINDHQSDIMSTPYTLMRCRMKHLISCFNACKLPIDKDNEQTDHHTPNTSSVIDEPNRETADKLKVETTSPVSSCESEEDEYIVFYFKEDEAGVDVIEERGLDAGCCSRRKKETSSERVRVDANPNVLEYEFEQHSHTLSESSESSSGSFAFPIIQREWTGSPVLMPRPAGHNKSCGVCIQCCKF